MGLDVMFTWHIAGINMRLCLWSIWKQKMLEISLLLLKRARIQLIR